MIGSVSKSIIQQTKISENKTHCINDIYVIPYIISLIDVNVK